MTIETIRTVLSVDRHAVLIQFKSTERMTKNRKLKMIIQLLIGIITEIGHFNDRSVPLLLPNGIPGRVDDPNVVTRWDQSAVRSHHDPGRVDPRLGRLSPAHRQTSYSHG